MADMKRCLSALSKVAQHSNRKPFVLNTTQCHHLAHTCVSWLQQTNLPSLPVCLLQELHGTLQEILAYFKSCTEDFWLSAVATHLDSHDAYLLHLKNFMVCIATSLALALYHSNASPFVDGFIQSMSDCEKAMSHSELNSHVHADRHAMLHLLRCAAQEEHEAHAHPTSKMKCFPFSFIGQRPQCNPWHRRLAAFHAAKSNEMVCLSATPCNVPKGFCMDASEIRIVRTIVPGENGFSKVFEGRWLHQRVAVKVFDKDDQTFVNETSMIAGLSNPYIIKLIGWAELEDQGTSWLVMEKMHEGLHTYMVKNSPSLQVKIDIMLQISRGMEYLHAMKVIHRDLKPSNVLVKPCENKLGYLRVKVSDFGVAKFKAKKTLYTTVRQGTAYYRAPEVLQYSVEVDNVIVKKYTLKADVFSFGILCYEVLAERAPKCFLCSPKEYYNRVTNNVRPDLPECSPTLLSRCIERCWLNEPTRRPSFAEISKMERKDEEALLQCRG
eukprot:c12029_g1_i2 orf=196-1683(-)